MPAEPTSPLSTEASPHAMIQRYELGFAPGGATRAVSETAVPGVVRWSTPTSSVGAGGGGKGPSLALHVAAHTASVATTATIGFPPCHEPRRRLSDTRPCPSPCRSTPPPG